MPPVTPPHYDTPQPPETSVLRLNGDNGQILNIRPDPTARTSADLLPVRNLTAPLHVLTAWSPAGRPTTLTDNVAAHEKLLSVVRKLHGTARTEVAVLAPDRSWAEQAVAISGLTDADVAALARRFEQPFAWRWESTGLTVLHGDGRAGPPIPVTTVEHRDLPCPMREDQNAVGFCTRPGGPWTSDSIAAAFRWERDWAVLLQALGGCTPCLGGSVLGYPGEPITAWTWSCASRYAPPQCLD